MFSIVSIITLIIALFGLSNAASIYGSSEFITFTKASTKTQANPTWCTRSDWSSIGNYCFKYVSLASSYLEATQICQKNDASLLNTNKLSVEEVMGVQNYIEMIQLIFNVLLRTSRNPLENRPYFWNDGKMSSFESTNSLFQYSNGSTINCKDSSFCYGQCEPDETFTQLYLKVKNNNGCIINGPPDLVPMPVVCQYDNF